MAIPTTPTTYSGTTGVLGIANVNTDKFVRDVTPGLQRKYKNIDPLFRIVNAIPQGKTAYNPKVEWITKDLNVRWAYLTTAVAASTAAGATVTLIPAHTEGGSADTERFVVGDVVEVPSRAANGTSTTNIGRVATVNADTSIVVDPIGWASNDESTSLKFIATYTNDKIHLLANAQDEYSQKPIPKVPISVSQFNYIQFLRVPYIIGNILLDQKEYTGTEREERREDTYREIRIQAELNCIFGERYYLTGTSGRKYFMSGIYRYIFDGAGSNIYAGWEGGMTEADWDDFLVKGPGFTGSNRKLLFASSDLFLKINSFAKTKERVQGTINMFGIEFTKYLAPDNKVYLMYHHHLFVEDHSGFGLIVDPAYIKNRPYGTQGTMQLATNIQENDRAGIADEWRIIHSLEVSRFEPHGVLTA